MASHHHVKSASSALSARITAVLLNNIAQSLPQYLFWKDTHSVYLGCNQRFAELLGLHSPAEIIGKTDYDLPWQSTGHTAEFFQQTDQEAMSDHPVDRQEECLRLPDGRQIITLVSKLPIKDEHQRILGVVGYFADITELKEKEQALQIAKQQAEAAHRAKSLFIANMSHDLRTPLTGLLGMVPILQQEIHSRRGQEAAHYLGEASQTLLKLVNEVIEFSQWTTRPLPVTAVNFSLPELIQELIRLMRPTAEEKHLSLTLTTDSPLPAVLCGDAARLRRILLNLISNAIKFTHHGGVHIAVESIQPPDQPLTVRIAVEDTGIGIDPSQQSLIFTPFSRLHPAYEGHYTGVGLGLALTKQLITDLRGTLTLASQPGQGSIFTCLLPLCPARQPRSKNPPTIKLHPLPSMFLNKTKTHSCWQVLLVEDSPVVQMAVKHQLTALNCEVDWAENGRQALERAAQKSYDLIFLDIGLPDVDGCEVAHRIRQAAHSLNQQTPIIALTAHLGADSQHTCLAAGMQRVLIKPLQPDQAREVLAKYAGQPCSSHLKRKKS